jgi:hypothetical protein
MADQTRKIGALVGLAMGFFMGSGTGVVGLFGGIPGFWLFFVIGGVLGWYVAPDVMRLKQFVFRRRR